MPTSTIVNSTRITHSRTLFGYRHNAVDFTIATKGQLHDSGVTAMSAYPLNVLQLPVGPEDVVSRQGEVKRVGSGV